MIHLLVALSFARMDDSALWSAVDAARNDAVPTSLAPDEQATASRFFSELVRTAAAGTLPRDLETRAAALGLDVEQGEGFVLLRPSGGAADGIYIVRIGEVDDPVVLQTPHSWFDLKTGRLGCLLFEEGVGQVLMMNSGQRYGVEGANADLADRSDTLFQAFTLGAAEALDQPLVVQLHGFGKKRTRAVAVLSPGSALHDPDVLASSRGELDELLRGKAVSGEAVPKLAGRHNAQGIALSSRARFLHLELSSKSRKQLVEDAELRAEFAAMLEDWAR